MSSVLVGMFDTHASAAEARERLLSAGLSPNAVSMTGGSHLSETDSTDALSTSTVGMAEPHHEGSIAHFFRSIFGSDTDDKTTATRTGYADTDTYTEAFKRGSYGVTVTAADDAEADQAEAILNDCGAVDIDERAESWRQEGWTGGNLLTENNTDTYTAAGSGLAAKDTGATQKLQEVEEELKVGKRAVQRGGVRIFSRMTEVPVSETVRLREEHANVTRTAVDRPATEADFSAFKEGSFEVRETGEEAVVSKTARVVGEVEVGKTATERDETVRDTVRKTTVDVEQLEPSPVKTGQPGVRVERASTVDRDPLTDA